MLYLVISKYSNAQENVFDYQKIESGAFSNLTAAITKAKRLFEENRDKSGERFLKSYSTADIDNIVFEDTIYGVGEAQEDAFCEYYLMYAVVGIDWEADNQTDLPNTRINYLYRDEENNKEWNHVVIPGHFSKDQIQTILDCMEAGYRFIPAAVGFEENRPGEWDDDIDGVFFEMAGGACAFEESAELPTVNKTPDEVVAAFQQCKGHTFALMTKRLSELRQKGKE